MFISDKLTNEKNQCFEHWASINFNKLESLANTVLKRFKEHADDKIKGHYIRQFHNALGYRAYGSLDEGGVCKGCLYRTESFIKIAQESRTGKKKYSANFTKVHIEHTIPVAVLTKMIDSFDVPRLQATSLMTFLLENSVVTAMLDSEGRTSTSKLQSNGLVLNGYSKKSGVFTQNHPHFDLPFMRYTGSSNHPKIYNVLTSEEIDITTFTMEKFKSDMRIVLNKIK